MTTDFYHTSINLTSGRASAKSNKSHRITISGQWIANYMALLNLGTDAVTERDQVKYTRICNFVAMASFLVSFVYIPLSILWANPVWFISVNSLCIISAAILCLNKAGKIYLSRIVCLLAIDTLLYLMALATGPHAYGANFLLIAVLLPFMIFDIDKPILIVTGICLPAILLMSYPYTGPLFAPYTLGPAQQQALHALGVPIEVALVAAAIFQLVYHSRTTEIKLIAAETKISLLAQELQRSGADMEQLTSVISHDLKTPVRNISCFMKLLANKHAASLDAEAAEFVDFAVKSSKRMEQLIDDVLAYSRTGRNLPVPAPVNINDIINAIRYELSDKPEMANATITTGRELPVIANVHSSLLYHIFQNLIRNGLKFNTSGHPQINVSCTEDSRYYTFSVHDNGIGMSEKYAAQVFQIFKRLHNEQEYDGTGIGLAICKKIAEYFTLRKS
jgi:signal transduction histidine kinase